LKQAEINDVFNINFLVDSQKSNELNLIKSLTFYVSGRKTYPKFSTKLNLQALIPEQLKLFNYNIKAQAKV